VKLRDLGEFPFLRRLQARVPRDARVQVGIGDDCAALALPGMTLLTTDTLVEGVHFLPDDPPEDVAWKLLAVNLSDLAAKGARPVPSMMRTLVIRYDAISRDPETTERSSRRR